MMEIAAWPRSSWSIFDDLESLQAQMNGMLNARGNAGTWRRSRPVYPLLNIWSSADGVVVDAELPGVDPREVDVSVMGDELTLRGKINVQEAAKGETCHRRERPSGEFSRTVQLPFRADSAKVKASFTNGLLRVTVPRCEEEKPRKIAVEAA